MGHDDRQVDARGFTLLEVVLALFVLALVAGLSVPAIGRGTDAIRARAEVAGFAAFLRHARQQAITTQRAHAVVVDTDRHAVAVRVDDKDVQLRSLPAHVSVQAEPATALTVRFEPNGVSTGADFRLTSGEIRYRVTVEALTGRVKNERL